MKPEKFLTSGERKAVTDAIRKAESETSGEIRIHLDGVCATDPVKRAAEVFNFLKMDRTELQNGVLIYVACESRVFSIIGDKGINEKVPENFWQDVTERMERRFKEKSYAAGLAEAVQMAGEKLKKYFPCMPDDVNEQPDEISFGK